MTKRAASVAKIVEIIEVSNNGWEDAAQAAIEETKKTIHNIHGIKIQHMTAKVHSDMATLLDTRLVLNY
jgi:flavin-binding protein dodecin